MTISTLHQLWSYGRSIEENFKNIDHLTYINAYKNLALVTQDLRPLISKLQSSGFKDLDHFYTFHVPLERHLDKNQKDSDFLIRGKDYDHGLEKLDLIFILHNIRSGYNIGSFFRLADCLNISKVYLTGYTASPSHHKVEKAALGSVAKVNWEKIGPLSKVIQSLQEHKIYALETMVGATSIYETSFAHKSAFVFGNEKFGLTQNDLRLSHKVLSIPTRGFKNSLNVTMSASIVSYEYLRQLNTNSLA